MNAWFGESRPLFRVFVSSSFRDFRIERELLNQLVFPRLREFCESRDARFQAIDLRWGISEEATENHQTMRICLDELRRCQSTTPRPNFLMLLGDRYGWRPLPSEIPEIEFQQLCDAVERSQDSSPESELSQLQRFYRLDLNAIEPERVLQPRDASFDEAQLRFILQQAALRAFAEDDPRRSKYFDSATHQEIRNGALASVQASEHVVCYSRNLNYFARQRSQSRDKVIDQEYHEYCDLVDDDGTWDIKADQRLCNLKSELRDRLGARFRSYDVSSPNDEAWLRSFTEGVFLDLSSIIQDALDERDVIAESMDSEATLHAMFGDQRCRHFTGRVEERERISEYLRQGSHDQPLLISGPGGSGKTALMANTAAELDSPEHSNTVTIVRFLGVTPSASDLRSMLISLTDEIRFRFQLQDESPSLSEMNEVVRYFHETLAIASANKTLVILLDALDQLNEVDGAHQLAWIPWNSLPGNCRLVLSMLDSDDSMVTIESRAIYERATSRIPTRNHIQLGRMSRIQGKELLNRWHADVGRRLTTKQQESILDGFESQQCGLPLWLKLAFEESRHWKSYDALPTGHDGSPGLSPGVPGILCDLFSRLEDNRAHGEVLTRRALGYIAAGRRGLTEDELIDVLSTDEDVMQDFALRSPTERESGQRQSRLPVLIWSRLHGDLESYLTDRNAFGTTVLSFYHRQVEDAVRRRYLDDGERLYLHQKLAKYFGDDTRHPYFLEDIDAQRERSRAFPPTPRPVNIRKVDELPYHTLEVAKLTGKDDPTALEWKAVADLLLNWEFLEAKAEAKP
ncbi:DUF4062 domain-containing protein [Stieleria varia]|uniref:NACHT domain protein n=1 Tax=Stieleria varia TaxID=2528005 RepID=A0A5C6A849_9BACT|nr:DUF4062 domain-containing protein [Stieleria varia]TWT94473.1 NACHT domain protein [Stieleria varia]